MDYQDYEVVDFLADEEFKAWVKSPDPARNLFWQQWLEAHPEKQHAIQKAREIILSMQHSDQDFQEHKYDVFRKVLKGEKSNRASHDHAEIHPVKKERPLFWLRAAAVFILLFGLTYYFRQIPEPEVLRQQEIAMVVKQNPNGRKSTFLLPDGSKVNLNAGSSLRFTPEFDTMNRVVYLEGEAYFQVEKDASRPFQVVAEGTVTTALGTAFNVKAWKGDPLVRVALSEGKVAVELLETEKDQVVLEPGQMLIHNQETEISNLDVFDPDLELGWKDGVLVFYHASLDEFVREIERWYGVTVMVEGKPAVAWSIDGKFENESLREILEGLSYTYKIDYTLEKNKVTLKL
jgi:ferric-dicitrate binding protein FerR (iron transport regulator)